MYDFSFSAPDFSFSAPYAPSIDEDWLNEYLASLPTPPPPAPELSPQEKWAQKYPTAGDGVGSFLPSTPVSGQDPSTYNIPTNPFTLGATAPSAAPARGLTEVSRALRGGTAPAAAATNSAGV
jgi:hypothetical protein